MPNPQTFFLLVSYEGTNAAKIGAALNEAGYIEHFDGSHVDGSRVYVVVADNESTIGAAKKKVQDLVWSVNGGAYADVKQLDEDEYDSYC